MRIGPTQSINDAFFPEIQINEVDRNGSKLSIRDKVKIRGCVAHYGYIGYSGGQVVVYFEANGVSVRWFIDKEVRQRIEKCQCLAVDSTEVFLPEQVRR